MALSIVCVSLVIRYCLGAFHYWMEELEDLVWHSGPLLTDLERAEILADGMADALGAGMGVDVDDS